MTQKLLDTLAAHPRLAKYMDMPLQHASRNVLARMKRGSHGDAFLEIAGAHAGNDSGRFDCEHPSSWDFPGKRRADFAELCDFVRAAQTGLDGRV